MITKTDVDTGSVGNKKGYCFSVYFDDREYPNLISALYKTKLGAKRKLNRYIKTGEFDFYGNAE